MELNKIIEKSKTIPTKIQTAFKKDLENIINILVENFDIYQRDSKIRIDKNTLNTFLIKNININGDTMCNAITKNGLQCTKKAYSDTNYCKIHYNKHIQKTIENKYINKSNENILESVNEPILLFENNENVENINIQDLEKKFIEDSFYLIDKKYIYDKNTYEKVGYISTDINNNKEFILTDDPFILGVYN